MTKLFLFSLAILCGVVTHLKATLIFENKTALVKLGPEEEAAKAQFRFTNSGDEVIQILEIKPSCGCTTATLEKKVYKPKESGAIAATLVAGGVPGFYSKSISVTTDEKSSNIYILTFNADIPEYYSVKPRLLFWNANEKLAAKEAEIVFGKNRAVSLVSAIDSSGKFKIETKDSFDHSKTTITVTPLEANFMPGEVVLNLKTEGGKAIKVSIFMRQLPSAATADPLHHGGS